MYTHVHVTSKFFFLRIVLAFMKKMWGIYNIIQFTNCTIQYTMKLFVRMVCNICIQYCIEIGKTGWLDKQRLFMLLSKFTFTSFKKLIGVRI